MKKVNIDSSYKKNYITIPNFFIDHYLAAANGDFVKVYIWLIKQVDQGYEAVSIENIADVFNLTEADVMRAIKYWHKMDVIEATWDSHNLTGIEILDRPKNRLTNNDMRSDNTEELQDSNRHDDGESNIPKNVHQFNQKTKNGPSVLEPDIQTVEPVVQRANLTKPSYTTSELVSFKSEVEYSQLVYITERYLGKNLTETDLRTLFSLHDWIGLPFEVIEILLEYCVSNNHRNLRYIEKVALDWADNDINTIEKATYRTKTSSKQYFTIFKALGIPNRNPVQFEIDMMNGWLKAFDIELILEACDRTIKQTNTGSLKYTDTILSKWTKENVKLYSDIERLDKSFIAGKESTKKLSGNNSTTGKKVNRFSNYNQRDYDFDDLEKKAIAMRLKETQKGS
ncbi:MAG: DnaD domain protein [Vallitaleaceae bacterium]|jgi:DnaD/phage-associated family protein|nr:DnaD domain protein [Vallitaleaceae bacterium]